MCLKNLATILAGAMLLAASAVATGAEQSSVPAQVERIDAELQQIWKDFEIRPTAEAADGLWARRLYLDLLGRIPTLAEVDQYIRDRSPRKRQELVERLLGEEYQAEYAQHWATLWTNILIGRSGGSERNSLTSREGLRDYLRGSFLANKPYDRFVRELVTASGTNKPGTEGYNGAVNYLIMKVNEERGTLATASSARTFLGLQVQCTQCHNHPFNTWKQQKFWELNAFFRQTRALRRFAPGSRDLVAAELVDEDFSGEHRDRDPTDAPIFYELRNGLLKVAYPVFVDGTAVGKSGLVRQLNRRAELAELMLASEYLDRMLVNRYWAHFLGYGFTKPIDDLGPHNPASHPVLLDYLAGQVRAHEYDLKQLIRWIVLSKPYSLSSQLTRRNQSDDPLLGEPPKFSRFYLRQMRPEELYASLIVATKANFTDAPETDQEEARSRWLSRFVTALGNDEGEETTNFNGTIPQTLMMFNGDLMTAATTAKPGNFLGEIVANGRSPKETIQKLFLAGLARRPTRDEIELANRLLAARAQDLSVASGGRRGKRGTQQPPAVAALEDLWWAILNSNEFITNH